jgi:hypothetical protein
MNAGSTPSGLVVKEAAERFPTSCTSERGPCARCRLRARPMIKALNEVCGRTVGIDVSEEMVRRARELHPEIQFDARHFPTGGAGCMNTLKKAAS